MAIVTKPSQSGRWRRRRILAQSNWKYNLESKNIYVGKKLVLCYKYRPAHHQHLSSQRLGGSHAVSGKISFVLTSDSHRLSRYCPACWWPPRPSWWFIPMAPLLPSIQTTPRPPRSTLQPWPRQDQSSTPTPLTPRTWQSHTWQLLLLSTTVGLGGFGSLHLIISSLELFSL